MSEKQSGVPQSGDSNVSSGTISQDVFAPPVMSSETRGASNTGEQMRGSSNGIGMTRTTFTKDED